MNLVGISLVEKYILLDDDTTMPIVGMMDDIGEDTEDCSKALGVVFQRPDGRFGVLHLGVLDPDHYITES